MKRQKYDNRSELEKSIDDTLESAHNVIKRAKEIKLCALGICGLLYNYDSIADIDISRKQKAIKQLKIVRLRIDKKLTADIQSVKESLDLIHF
jgi:sensor domain CHASE-containing protein